MVTASRERASLRWAKSFECGTSGIPGAVRTRTEPARTSHTAAARAGTSASSATLITTVPARAASRSPIRSRAARIERAVRIVHQQEWRLAELALDGSRQSQPEAQGGRPRLAVRAGGSRAEVAHGQLKIVAVRAHEGRAALQLVAAPRLEPFAERDLRRRPPVERAHVARSARTAPRDRTRQGARTPRRRTGRAPPRPRRGRASTRCPPRPAARPRSRDRPAGPCRPLLEEPVPLSEHAVVGAAQRVARGLGERPPPRP